MSIFNTKLRNAKIVLGGAVLVGLGVGKVLWDLRLHKLHSVKNLDLNLFQGKWYEIARKPVSVELPNYRNISITYKQTESNHLRIELEYLTVKGEIGHFIGEADITNPPDNSHFSVSYLPSILKNLKKGKYWVMRIDPDYQIALIGSPKRNRLWLISRTPKLDSRLLDDYLTYAHEQGFNLKDIIKVEHEVV